MFFQFKNMEIKDDVYMRFSSALYIILFSLVIFHLFCACLCNNVTPDIIWGLEWCF